MPAHEFGLDNTFRTSPKWGGIMANNLAKVQEGLSRLAVQDRNYRNVRDARAHLATASTHRSLASHAVE